MKYRAKFSTHVAASKEEVWKWITSIDGISKEMSPYMHMSTPASVSNLQSISYVPGKRLFRSWITLFKIIPFDYSDLTLESLEEGVGFVEQSPMGSMRFWRHERKITPAAKGCILTDELTFEPRFASFVANKIINAFFRHRHRMLSRYLGVA